MSRRTAILTLSTNARFDLTLDHSPIDHVCRRKECKFEAVIQGRFKRATPFSHVYTGQALNEPLSHIPAKWLVGAGLRFMSRLQPALRVRLQGEKPYFLSPLASTAQKIGKTLIYFLKR